MYHKCNLFDVLWISDEGIEAVQTLILGDKVRITYDLLKEGGKLIESVDLFFLASIEWVRVKVLALAVLRVLDIKLLANLLVGLDSDLPLSVLNPLSNWKVVIVCVLLSGSILCDVLLVAICLVEFFDGYVIKLVHEFPPLLLLVIHVSVVASLIVHYLLLLRHESSLILVLHRLGIVGYLSGSYCLGFVVDIDILRIGLWGDHLLLMLLLLLLHSRWVCSHLEQ